MRAYSLDLRHRIIAALEAGQAAAAVAERFAVSARTVRRYRTQWQAEGQLNARTSPGRPPRIVPAQYDALSAQVLANPDATLVEHCQQWAAATGVGVSEATMCRVLQKLELTRKKSA
jgi:putative transposase